MKNKITLLGCLFFAFGIADAAEFTGTYNNDGGHRTTLSGLSKNIDAVLNSTPNEAADSGINYRGGSQTMKSMTVVDRTSTPEVAGDANIAGNFTIDTNSAGAYQGLSVNNMTLVASNVVVKNSLSSTAAVNLNFGPARSQRRRHADANADVQRCIGKCFDRKYHDYWANGKHDLQDYNRLGLKRKLERQYLFGC